MLNISEEPALGIIATNNTKISSSQSINKNKKQKREKMTEAELDWLNNQMGIDPDFLAEMPGFENFEVVPDDYKSCRSRRQLRKDAEKSQKIMGLRAFNINQDYSVEDENYFFGEKNEPKVVIEKALFPLDPIVQAFKGKTNQILPKIKPRHKEEKKKGDRHQRVKKQTP